MVKKETITTTKVPSGRSYVSQGVRYGNLIFVCGMGPADLGGDIHQQTASTLLGIGYILEEAGASMADILKVTVYLSDIRNYPSMNEEYQKFFPEDPPVRTCVQALSPSGPDGQLVEMDAIAALPE